MGRPLPKCVTSQDATDAGLAALLTGDIYMTVFKDSRLEAQATALLASSLLSGETPNNINGITNNGTIKVPSIILRPESITRSGIRGLFDLGFTTQGRVCSYLPTPIKCSIAN
jgi:D-xylose transport system substrate-binding protein